MQQKKRLSKNTLAAIVAVSIFTFTLAGTTCGTFAWFVYATSADVGVRGVTIGSGELQMGVVSNVVLHDYNQYGLTEDRSNPGEVIYWFQEKSVTPRSIHYVLKNLGYATNEFYPVTSKAYSRANPVENFTLYGSPNQESSGGSITSTRTYFHLPLVFRHSDDIDPGFYQPDINIYLAEAHVSSLNEDSEIHRSVRFFTDDKLGNKHLINPSSNEDGEINVGGILDLSNDGYFDTFIQDNKNYEYIYGEYENVVYNSTPIGSDTDIVGPHSCFNSKHKAGTYTVDLEHSSFKKAEYEGFPKFRNKRVSVTSTNPATHNYAYLDLTIYSEGWDLSSTDRNATHPFVMDIKFEVDF